MLELGFERLALLLRALIGPCRSQQRRLDLEIADAFLIGKPDGTPLPRYAAAIQNVHAVGKRQREFHILLAKYERQRRRPSELD